jgi:hypothetical protein
MFIVEARENDALKKSIQAVLPKDVREYVKDELNLASNRLGAVTSLNLSYDWGDTHVSIMFSGN